MNFRQLTEARRSVRAFAGPATRDELAAVCDTARRAPSWKNLQPARCYVAEGAETLARLREALPPFNRDSSANAALIVTTFVRDSSGFTQGVADNEAGNLWGAYDLGLHDACLVLAAADMGLDTLIMGIRDAAAIRALLAIPDGEEVMSVIAVGRRAGEAPLRPRRALEETVRFF